MELTAHIQRIRQHVQTNYQGMYREAGDNLPYPFLVPGSEQYDDVLWDWDSWLSDVALRQILLESEEPEAAEHALTYEQGCVLNYLSYGRMDTDPDCQRIRGRTSCPDLAREYAQACARSTCGLYCAAMW